MGQVLDTQIEQAVAEFAPGARLVRSWPLKGGISATMTAFEIEQVDGSLATYIARIPSDFNVKKFGDAVAHEVKTLQALRAAGLKVAETYFSHEQFYVLEYLPGAPDLNPTDLDMHLKQYAEQLAAIHKIPFAGSGLEFLPSYGFKVWDAGELAEDLRESELRDALTQYGAPQLSQPVLRHGDYWPGNLLWQDGSLTGVIDWESANIGEPLADLACTRLDVLWVYGEEAMHTATDYYLASNPLSTESLAFWDLRAALRMTEMFSKLAEPYPGFGRPDVTDQSMRRDFLRFVDLALVRL